MTVENQLFQELDGDQRREVVNTRQRFETFLAAQERVNGYRGSMTFTTSNGADDLVRSFPRDVVADAAPLFDGEPHRTARFAW